MLWALFLLSPVELNTPGRSTRARIWNHTPYEIKPQTPPLRCSIFAGTKKKRKKKKPHLLGAADEIFSPLVQWILINLRLGWDEPEHAWRACAPASARLSAALRHGCAGIGKSFQSNLPSPSRLPLVYFFICLFVCLLLYLFIYMRCIFSGCFTFPQNMSLPPGVPQNASVKPL